MRRCEDEKMWRFEDVKMWRWEDVKMRRCENMWNVRMRRCEDEKMWKWENVKLWGCEDEKMWELKMWCEDVKIVDRPPLLEEPFAQTLSGKNASCVLNGSSSKITEISDVELSQASCASWKLRQLRFQPLGRKANPRDGCCGMPGRAWAFGAQS